MDVTIQHEVIYLHFLYKCDLPQQLYSVPFPPLPDQRMPLYMDLLKEHCS